MDWDTAGPTAFKHKKCANPVTKKLRRVFFMASYLSAMTELFPFSSPDGLMSLRLLARAGDIGFRYNVPVDKILLPNYGLCDYHKDGDFVPTIRDEAPIFSNRRVWKFALE